MFDKNETAKKLCKIAEDLRDKYKELSDADYKQYMSGLKPGQTVQKKGRLVMDASKRELIKACAEARVAVNSIIDEARYKAGSEMAEPPSAGAVSYIQTLRGRRRISQTELDAAVRKYGDNWSCYQALQDIAQQQCKNGNVVFVKLGNTLEDADSFIDGASSDIKRYIADVQVETSKDPESLESRTAWVQMIVNGRASGESFGSGAGVVGSDGENPVTE